MSRATNEYIAQGLSNLLGGYAQGYAKVKETEDIERVINDPNATLIQKVNAISKRNPKAGAEMLKQYNQQSLIAQIDSDLQNRLNPNQEYRPNSAQDAAQNATNLRFPTSEIPGIGMNAPPGTQMPEPEMNVPLETAPQNPVDDLRRKADAYRKAADQATKAQLSPQTVQNYRSQAEAFEADARAKEKLERQNLLADKKQLFDIHQSEKAEFKDLQKSAHNAKIKLQARDVMRSQLATGKLDPKSVRNIAANFFKGHPTLEGLFTTPEREVFKSAGITQFEGMKDVFGSKSFTDADLAVAATKIMDPSKPVAANLAIADFWDFSDKMKVEEAKIAQQVKKENGGYLPINWKEQVDERMQERFGDEVGEIVRNAATEAGTRPLKIIDGKVAMISKEGKRKLIPIEDMKSALLAEGLPE